MTFPRSAAASAIVVFLLTSALGVIAGYAIGAARYEMDGTTASMVTQPLDGSSKTFNWLIFCAFGAAGIVAGAVAWAGALINNAIIESTVYQLEAAQPNEGRQDGRDG